MSLIEETCFNKMDRRLSEYLLQRFKNDGSPVWEIECTHEQIAMELGSAREVISRILQELKRSGAIELARKKITLKDMDKLRAMIDIISDQVTDNFTANRYLLYMVPILPNI